MRTGLVLPYMLGLDVISFSVSMFLLFFCLIFFSTKNKKKKKIGGEDAEFYSLDSFSDIACVFA
jgi:hypothetical protein